MSSIHVATILLASLATFAVKGNEDAAGQCVRELLAESVTSNLIEVDAASRLRLNQVSAPVPIAATTSAEVDIKQCSIKQENTTGQNTCSTHSDGANGKCSTQSTGDGSHKGGYTCSIVSSNANNGSEKCSVLFNTSNHECSTFTDSSTSNADACSVTNTAEHDASCSVIGSLAKGECSAKHATSTSQRCSAVATGESEASCSVSYNAHAGATCTLYNGAPLGTCSIQSIGSIRCSVIQADGSVQQDSTGTCSPPAATSDVDP